MLLGKSELEIPVVAVGCYRMHNIEISEAKYFLKTALDLGANFFEHADIYGQGRCEEMFPEAIGLNADLREKVIIQSKCGMVKNVMHDSSEKHILEAVDGSLHRLKTDYLDVLLIHRPDMLVEPEEVASAFDKLRQSGKVRHFGVSNHGPRQIELLQKYLTMPLLVDQLQLSIAACNMISSGMHVNMQDDKAVSRDGYIVDFCRINDITIQPWSPFQYGFFDGVFLDNDKFPELNAKIDEIAEKYGVSNVTIAMAWLLRHPAHMQPITGTMNIQRLKDCFKAAEILITREEWYAIYLAAGNIMP
jgi:predicted oxidoreductase